MQQIAQARLQTNESPKEALNEIPNPTQEGIPSDGGLPQEEAQEEVKIAETIEAIETTSESLNENAESNEDFSVNENAIPKENLNENLNDNPNSNENPNPIPQENVNEIPPQADSPTLNHIIRQVIQEFMESQPKQSSLDSKESESWEEEKDKAQKEPPKEAQNSNTYESLMQNPSFLNSTKATEINEAEIPYIQPFVANNIPNYGYMPTPQSIPQEKMSTSEVISLFDNATKAQKVPNSVQNVESQTLEDSAFKNLETKEDNLNLANESALIASASSNAESLSHSAQTEPQNAESQSAESKEFVLPKLEFLQAPKEERVEIDEGEIDRKINDLLSKLRMFKIEGDIVRTYSGPIVTTFEFRPSPNVKVSRILTLQDDLAMALRAKTIRIQAPVPGKDVVGIEIPNNQIETIYLREILENESFVNSTSPLTLALGKDIVGNPFVTDLKKLPHLLIAGTTGSGKSVGINAMILSLLYKNSPKQLKLIMIDPKMLEFSIYNEIPHLLTPVITQPKKAIIALDNTVKEMERRYALMSEARIKNIEGYNQKAEIEGFEPFPYIVVIIDELADLMMSGGKEAEVSISRLAQMARASGIHLIVATQRPSVDVVTGLIKANLPSRISYKVGQKIDSKVILDSFGAESLLGRGDMLFTPPGGGIVRLHAPWSTENEIEKIVEFIKSQCPPQYDESFMPNEDEVLGLRVEGETDELYEEAKRIILNDGKTSISYIQRRLGIGYNKAANIIEQMQARGFLSEPNSKGVREILGD
ncbi:DNA translocase FtsK [Helicobacter sp. MIT 05-5294]|nr:DNA translocase FtsK [Helicobacter sp. MIT 05-5294]